MRSRGSLIDTALDGATEGLRTCFTTPRADSALPSAVDPAADAQLAPQERQRSVSLLRVNHAGEVAAQALYYGQALFARSPETLEHLLGAAAEERDHLAWCAQRITELDGTPSRLTPLWFAGSYVIGALAGLAGDRHSMGFIEETERQVEAHLEDHLGRIPENDARSRDILERMSADEARHGAQAAARGSDPVPAIGRQLMRLGGSILRQVAQVM